MTSPAWDWTCQNVGLFPVSGLVPLDGYTYLTVLLPPILLFWLLAALVTVPRTHYTRLAILPVLQWLTFRAATRIDTPPGSGLGLMTLLVAISLRSIGWALEREPLIRIDKYGPTGPAKPRSFWDLLCDATELSANMRGLGWNWAIRGIPPAPPSHVNTSRKAFLWACIKRYLFYGGIYEGLLLVYPYLFSPSLPVRDSFRPLMQAFVYPVGTWAILAAYQEFYTLCGVFIFGQEPSTWRPLYDAPWQATSLTELWGIRWQQGLRDMLAKSLGRIFYTFTFRSRVGYVMGTFVASGLFHEAGFWGLSRATGLCAGCSMFMFFTLAGVGVVLEGFFRKFTGKRVGGAFGWIWMLSWSVMGFSVSMNEGCMNDLYRSLYFNVGARPWKGIFMLVEAVVNAYSGA